MTGMAMRAYDVQMGSYGSKGEWVPAFPGETGWVEEERDGLLLGGAG